MRLEIRAFSLKCHWSGLLTTFLQHFLLFMYDIARTKLMLVILGTCKSHAYYFLGDTVILLPSNFHFCLVTQRQDKTAAWKTRVLIILFVCFFNWHISAATSISFRWCATNGEMDKCLQFIQHVNKTAQDKSLPLKVLSCVKGKSYDDCATQIKASKADLVTLDGGRVYAAGTNIKVKKIIILRSL